MCKETAIISRKGCDKADLNQMKNNAVPKKMTFLYCGNMAEARRTKTASAAKSDNFPVSQFPYAAFQYWSFKTSSNRLEIKKGCNNKLVLAGFIS